jgi:CheY-like chemotaxis protein
MSSTQLVLVADDHDDAAGMLALTLSVAGSFETLIAKAGAQAIRQAVAHHPSICILDVEMPECDGLTVARALRDHFGERRPYLIAMTGGPRLDDALLSGLFDDVMKKPLDLSRLLKAMKSAQDDCQSKGLVTRSNGMPVARRKCHGRTQDAEALFDDRHAGRRLALDDAGRLVNACGAARLPARA